MRQGTPPASGGRRRIAVVGSGISGLSAAWLLSRRNHVTLYEKHGWLGGHARTVDVPTTGGLQPVDTGFIVYNERNYPNLTALFEHLGVATEPSSMSFAASMDGGTFEYSSDGLNRYCGQRLNLIRPRFWRMTADLLRFYRAAKSLNPEHLAPHNTIGEYLHRQGYSDTFIEDHILPMSAAIWSTTTEEIKAYPIRAFLRFFGSHGLLDIWRSVPWRTVTGGSREYVRRLAAPVQDVRGEAVRLERDSTGVTVTDRLGRSDRFAEIVIATHADQALRLLDQPDELEQAILGAFSYTRNEVVLHADPSLMPRRRRVWSSWNFIGEARGRGKRQLTVTYWMNRLQNIDPVVPLFVTLNPHREPAPDKVLGGYHCSHPYFDHASLNAQGSLWKLQGRRRTWFCGAYFGYGFHEDGVQAGLGVAEILGGVTRPWRVDRNAERIASLLGSERTVEVA